MRYQQDLQIAVGDRQRRILNADYAAIAHEIMLTTGWINGQPVLRGILAEAELVEPHLDFEAWEKSLTAVPVFTWTNRTEEGRATLAWRLMRQLTEADPEQARDAVLQYASRVTRSRGRSNSVDDMCRLFTEMVLDPLFEFLIERVGTESSTLHILERYVRRLEWFDRDELYGRFKNNTRSGEEIYNLDLQRFLLLDGDYLTHAKVRSASGEPDLVGDLDTDDPLVCDGKIFDGDGRGKNYLAKGVNQIVQYAGDYNKNVAYLVIFNITGRSLQLPTDGPEAAWPPHIELAGVRVYLIAVRALPPENTASKQGKPRPITITRQDFIKPDA